MMQRTLSITRIKNLRIDHDYKQKEISEYLQISRGTYSQIECGLRELKSDEIEKLAILYDVIPEYLLGLIDTPINYPKEIKSQVMNRLNITNNMLDNFIYNNL